MNSDLIEVSDDVALVLRLNTFQEANVKPLQEVALQIKTILINQKATDKAQQTIDSLLIELSAGNDVSTQLADLKTSFIEEKQLGRYGSQVDQGISRAAFVLPHPIDGVISASTVALSNGDLALVELIKVNVDETAENANLGQQQTSQLAQSAYQSFVNSLKVDAEINRKVIAEPARVY
jgi:peptidyl-prolyl cis-trans isomerase D